MKDLEKFMAKCEANSVPDRKINTNDIPELTEEDFARGYLRNWKSIKKSITFRIDLDNLQWLQSEGSKDYQRKINEVLRWARQNGCPITQF